MLVYDYRSNKKVDQDKTYRGVIAINGDCLEYGYFSPKTTDVFVKTDQGVFPVLDNSILEYTFFDGRIGYYVLMAPYKKGRQDVNLKVGRGKFPYSFNQKYEAIHNFDKFKDAQYLVKKENDFGINKYLPFTFGLEFETSSGYIPEDICLRDGLIPLRDGSITGLEYSTVILKGNNGLNMLQQQINTLNKYTVFDKECSLHMHIGCPVITKSFVWNFYVLLVIFQNELVKYVPEWTFESNRYKATRKNYCSKIPKADNFYQWYQHIAGQEYDGNLKIPHRNDPDRTHKWQVHSRYFDFNFVNLMCYESPKTIEFRFLRPTYEFAEIETWLLLFMLLIQAAYNACKDIRDDNFDPVFNYYQSKYGQKDILFNIFKELLPEDLANKMIYRMKIINNVHSGFKFRKDYPGLNHDLKSKYFNNSQFNDPL